MKRGFETMFFRLSGWSELRFYIPAYLRKKTALGAKTAKISPENYDPIGNYFDRKRVSSASFNAHPFLHLFVCTEASFYLSAIN
jgi:hypothetical protein